MNDTTTRRRNQRRKQPGSKLRQAAALAMAGVTLGLLGADVSTLRDESAFVDSTYLVIELVAEDGTPLDEACRWWVLSEWPSGHDGQETTAALIPLAGVGWDLEPGCLAAAFNAVDGGSCDDTP
mgnify:CR=1 FL=1